MLYTNLKHIEKADEFTPIIDENENVLIVCGRMDSSSIAVYRMAEELEQEYLAVKFYDLESDNPELADLVHLPELIDLPGIPFVLYYKNGNLVNASTDIKSKRQLKAVLDHE